MACLFVLRKERAMMIFWMVIINTSIIDMLKIPVVSILRSEINIKSKMNI